MGGDRIARVKASLGVVAAIVSTAAACLVFDGKVATDFGDAASDAQATRTLTPEPGISCWAGIGAPQYCPFGTACCLAQGATSTGWFTAPDACAPGGACPGDGFQAFACDSPFDCADSGLAEAVCCASAAGGSRCLSASACRSKGVVLCNPADSPPCEDGGACVAAGDGGVVPPGDSVCM
jgi:hypothetical protein